MRRLFGRGSAQDSPPAGSSSPSSPSPFPPLSINTTAGPARPIRFVYCDEKGKFQIDPEALAVLQLVKEPCGRARQGKSYILNQLLGRSSGFHVASTHRPCTKGLWLWSAPVRRTALDGTEYNLLLLDTEGIDAYDQTGTYSTQIFSLAVLLSSMFIYNQMGGIDEVALDRLSLVTEMSKHIRVRASGGGSSISELGQFAPTFIWLLRDFYLELTEDNRKITPRDYLELALSPVVGRDRDVVDKNKIRESIRALFPERECFTLVRPLSNENELQRLDQIPLDRLRPEFKAGLDTLTRFVFERTKAKQIGSLVMTGPIFARITQSFLDALNNGAVPTITTSWQSVEEAECQRAYDLAAEIYMSTFDRSKPPEEAALREAHEYAVQKSLSAFNATAVGAGPIRQKYEKRLQSFVKKAFEDIKRDSFSEAYQQCSNSIQEMEKDLRKACHAPDAKIDNVLKVLDHLLSKYEASCHGPEKWRKLVIFLQQSLEGPLLDLTKKQIDQIGAEKTSLVLKCRSIEDKMGLLNKQLEASEKYKSEYLRRYEDAINDKKKLGDDYMSRITTLQSKCSSLEERCSSLSKTLDSARQESLEWKRKSDQLLSKHRADEDQINAEISILKSRTSAAEARVAAAKEQAHAAQEEAEEWKRKYEIAVKEVKVALEKAAVFQEQANKQTQLREEALRKEFSITLAEKEDYIKDKTSKLEHSEQRLTTLSLELKAAEAKIKNYDLEVSSLKLEIKELGERLENINATAQSFEREARILEQEKVHLQQKYQSEFDRFEEVQERCKLAEREAKRLTEFADKARAEAALAHKERSETQRLAMERLARIERAERLIENLERQKADLTDEVSRHRAAEVDAQSKVAMLEARVEEREKEMESLLKSNNEQRATTVQVLERLLESERAARAESSNRAELLSVQLQATQGKLDLLQQQMTRARLNETALDSKLRTASIGKRARVDEYETGVESVHDLGTNDGVRRGNKRYKSTTSPLKMASPEDGGSVYRGDDDSQSQQTNSGGDYTRFTVLKLKQELTKHNFGAELLQLKNPNKKDILALYEKCVLQKS
nr:guanylate-binding protein 1-like [Ipomoea batatas]